MSKRPIIAAGGVVRNPNGLIAVVYRAEQNDWTLPKGKLIKGETIEACAVREVYEESGVLVTVDRFLTHSQYKLKDGKQKGRLKIVYWFALDYIEQADVPLPKDVQKREWYHPEDVYGILTHKKDRKVLDAFFYA